MRPFQLALPLRAVPREELEVSGQRLIEDTASAEVAYVPFDEDAEDIVTACNAYPDLIALRDAVGVFFNSKASDQSYSQIITPLLDAYMKAK